MHWQSPTFVLALVEETNSDIWNLRQEEEDIYFVMISKKNDDVHAY